MKRFSPFAYDQPIDASQGLIFRLNMLWQRSDFPASEGNFEKWNFILDRIFCNLMYKNNLDILKDNEGRIIDVKFSDEDQQTFQHLNSKVWEAQEEMRNVKTKKELHKANAKLYQALMMKDIGLRKFMHNTLKLYLRESSNNPSKSLFGGG